MAHCRKSDKWRTWKNNNGGGAAYYIRLHLIKDHSAAYLAACEQIGYSPDERLSQNMDDDNVSEPITGEGILKFLTEWFAEDDIVSCIPARLMYEPGLIFIMLVL
jgi:hypothetical protein